MTTRLWAWCKANADIFAATAAFFAVVWVLSFYKNYPSGFRGALGYMAARMVTVWMRGFLPRSTS